jgi:hypothetical protein
VSQRLPRPDYHRGCLPGYRWLKGSVRLAPSDTSEPGRTIHYHKRGWKKTQVQKGLYPDRAVECQWCFQSMSLYQAHRSKPSGYYAFKFLIPQFHFKLTIVLSFSSTTMTYRMQSRELPHHTLSTCSHPSLPCAASRPTLVRSLVLET